MSCRNPVLNEDGERVCECGDEGRACESCAAETAALWADLYRTTPLSERDPQAYEDSLRDAGRGHLVRP